MHDLPNRESEKSCTLYLTMTKWKWSFPMRDSLVGISSLDLDSHSLVFKQQRLYHWPCYFARTKLHIQMSSLDAGVHCFFIQQPVTSAVMPVWSSFFLFADAPLVLTLSEMVLLNRCRLHNFEVKVLFRPLNAYFFTLPMVAIIETWLSCSAFQCDICR